MKLYRTSIGFYVNYETHYYHLPHADWDVLINRDDLYDYLKTFIQTISPADFVNFSTLLAPI
ncbi:MAG: 2-hydroxyhepta-2,4-diene-1,7-dioate isomerase, partial [Runella zeae]